MYLGQIINVEVNLGESMVIQLSEKLKGTYFTFSTNLHHRNSMAKSEADAEIERR